MAKKTTKSKKQKKATPFTTLKKSEKAFSAMKEKLSKKEAGEDAAKAPKDDRVVFAFRLTKDERDLIHQAAGPRGASRFVLEAALAAAALAKK